MRHVWSLLGGVLAAPLAWGLIAVGQTKTQQTVTGWVNSGTYNTRDLIEPLAYLAVAGIVLGLIATLRISPLGPLVAGLLLGGIYVGMFIRPLDLRDAVPNHWELLDRQILLRAPLDNGTLLLVAFLLLMATFSAQRWRRWPAPVALVAEDEAPTEPMTPVESLWAPPDPVAMQPTPAPAVAEPPRSPSPSPWADPPRTRSE